MIVCLCIALTVIIILSAKLQLIKKSAREIREQLAQRLSDDTNTLIDISSSDKDMRALADGINDRLKVLRAEYLRYSRGDAELKRSVTNISHDLRTPLTAICGYLDFLKKEEISPQAREYLDIITERTNALRQLTEELLRYSSSLSGEKDIILEELALNSILEESILSLRAAFEQRGIIPEIDITDKKIICKADRAAVSRIFSNLLGNALKYSDGDLTVTMNDDGTIKFINSASALNSVQVGRLFDRYYTVQSGEQSSGLGLSNARSLAEQQGGTITASLDGGKLEITLILN